MENKCINKAKNQSFEKTNKADEPITRLIGLPHIVNKNTGLPIKLEVQIKYFNINMPLAYLDLLMLLNYY